MRWVSVVLVLTFAAVTAAAAWLGPFAAGLVSMMGATFTAQAALIWARSLDQDAI